MARRNAPWTAGRIGDLRGTPRDRLTKHVALHLSLGAQIQMQPLFHAFAGDSFNGFRGAILFSGHISRVQPRSYWIARGLFILGRAAVRRIRVLSAGLAATAADLRHMLPVLRDALAALPPDVRHVRPVRGDLLAALAAGTRMAGRVAVPAAAAGLSAVRCASIV